MANVSSKALAEMADRLRILSITSTSKAGSGHPSSCASMAELMSVLFFDVMRYHPDDPRNLADDRFILSKGHAAPILYAAWAEAGIITREDLLTLRRIDSDLEGHPFTERQVGFLDEREILPIPSEGSYIRQKARSVAQMNRHSLVR